MIPPNEFDKYAVKHKGINSLDLDRYKKIYNVAPYILEERQLNVAAMDIFSRLLMDRIIFLGDVIGHEVANIVEAQLLYLDSVDPSKDIQLYLNTGGGNVYSGMGIYDTMQYIGSDVATICTGIAASLGAVLLTAGTNGKRSALQHARVMIHQPFGYTGGQASDIEIDVRETQRSKKELYNVLSQHTGVAIEQIEKDADRDFWMSATEAKEYGLIDEVLAKQDEK